MISEPAPSTASAVVATAAAGLTFGDIAGFVMATLGFVAVVLSIIVNIKNLRKQKESDT